MSELKPVDFYQKNMYGVWREGEDISYEILGEEPAATPSEDKPFNPFEVRGGIIVRITAATGSRKTAFTVHAYLPEAEDAKRYPNGSPFIICFHPIMPADFALKHGYALLVMESTRIASDDTAHRGAFYDLYPYGQNSEEQTGVLMAWAWGASKILDAVRGSLGHEFGLDPEASMVTGVSRWGKATAVCGAFDTRFRMTIPACSGAGGLALYSVVSEGNTYDFSRIGGPSAYTYGKNEPLDCLQSDAERGWFNDAFLQYKTPSDIPMDQENLVVMAMAPDRYYFVIAAYTKEDWVNAPAMWECCKRAASVYTAAGLSDRLAVHFHLEGHAVIEEDMDLIIRYFDHMYYGRDTGIGPDDLKTTLFAE
ncbi:MAG: hypothetical protein J6X17_06615 [Lachnospiraceae bacterium]|nr:hypothetical protein [Lachnospiraceae bacterium]